MKAARTTLFAVALTVVAGCGSLDGCEADRDAEHPDAASVEHSHEQKPDASSQNSAEFSSSEASSLPSGTARQREALNAAKRAVMLDRSDDALTSFGDVLEEGPWSQAQLEAVTHLVQMLIERDRIDRANKLLDNQVPDSARDLESLQLLSARLASASGDLDSAISMYRDVLDDKPDRLVLYPRLAALYEKTNQPDSAEQMRTKLDERIEQMASDLDSESTPSPRKLMYLDALQQVSTPDAVDAATDALTDPDSDVRIAAARALGDMGSRRAAPELRALAERTDNEQLRNAARAAIRRISVR